MQSNTMDRILGSIEGWRESRPVSGATMHHSLARMQCQRLESVYVQLSAIMQVSRLHSLTLAGLRLSYNPLTFAHLLFIYLHL